MEDKPTREIHIPDGSSLNEEDYRLFLRRAYALIAELPHYCALSEGIDSLELAHIIPAVPETVIAIYVGINDTVCNKALVTPFLVRHAHKNVFVFDPHVYLGGDKVPDGTVDARKALNGFEPPNASWNPEWTYVMIENPALSFRSVWQEKGYIDMIAAKCEDFTMVSDHEKSRICFFIDEKAFEHPVNMKRDYLKDARKRGEATAGDYVIPQALEGEVNGLVPVVLQRGEKLYVATPDFSPCDHAWSTIHSANEGYAVVNENSAVPLDLVIAKPPLKPEYSEGLIPARGSADLTTDWFYRGNKVTRKPLLEGAIKG